MKHKIKHLFKNTIIIILFLFVLNSCQEDKIEPISIKDGIASVTPHQFNWETIDWMPTPPGQSQIPVPWIGQGSIASIYGTDVIQDIKSYDGWELVYNTFDPNSAGSLINPYFVLYNKYRGLMRIYLYTTTQFIAPSTYIQDGLSIISSYETSMLNFMGTDLVDPTINQSSYSQMQPAPDDGSLPLASNKWYMMQYEFAYDANISNIPYNNILLNWSNNFHNVEEISLGGDIKGTIKSAVGSTGSNIFSALGNVGKAVGKVALSGIGKNLLDKNTIDATTGENKLGLPDKVFKEVLKGAGSAVSSSTKEIPGAVFNLFSAILGGSSGPTALNLNLNADIDIEGTATNSGSFPSSPTSMYVPGTNISNSATGYIPLFNKKLGVFNISAKPEVNVHRKIRIIRSGNPRDGFKSREVNDYTFEKLDYSSLIQINPEVANIAEVKVIKQELILITRSELKGPVSSTNGSTEIVGVHDEVYVDPTYININGIRDFDTAIRFTIQVDPNNGAPTSNIVKTFIADQNRTVTHSVEI